MSEMKEEKRKDYKLITIETWKNEEGLTIHAMGHQNCNWMEIGGMLLVAELKYKQQTLELLETKEAKI